MNPTIARNTWHRACNPPLAHKVLPAELQAGLLLPCNVIVYDEDEGTVVAAVDPEAAMSITGNQAPAEIAREARERLKRAIKRLSLLLGFWTPAKMTGVEAGTGFSWPIPLSSSKTQDPPPNWVVRESRAMPLDFCSPVSDE